MAVILRTLHTGIRNVVAADLGIFIGNIKKSLLPKALSPAIGAEKGPVSFRLRGKSLPGKGIIPSNDHHIVIGLVGSVIKICAPVSSALLRQIQGALNASRLINGTLDGVIVLFSQKLHRLDMAHWRKPLRGNMVPVRIIGLRCRPLPA